MKRVSVSATVIGAWLAAGNQADGVMRIELIEHEIPAPAAGARKDIF